VEIGNVSLSKDTVNFVVEIGNVSLSKGTVNFVVKISNVSLSKGTVNFVVEIGNVYLCKSTIHLLWKFAAYTCSTRRFIHSQKTQRERVGVDVSLRKWRRFMEAIPRTVKAIVERQ
jgi:uncharacterized surface anchored protein